MSSLITYIGESLIVILPLLGSIAFMTLAERKVMGSHNKNRTQQLKYYSTNRNLNNKIPSFTYDEITGCIKSCSTQDFILNNIDLSRFSIIPIKIFTDAPGHRPGIINKYKNICEIQLRLDWVNKKMYVGSGRNFSRRLSEYYFISKLTRIN